MPAQTKLAAPGRYTQSVAPKKHEAPNGKTSTQTKLDLFVSAKDGLRRKPSNPSNLPQSKTVQWRKKVPRHSEVKESRKRKREHVEPAADLNGSTTEEEDGDVERIHRRPVLRRQSRQPLSMAPANGSFQATAPNPYEEDEEEESQLSYFQQDRSKGQKLMARIFGLPPNHFPSAKAQLHIPLRKPVHKTGIDIGPEQCGKLSPLTAAKIVKNIHVHKSSRNSESETESEDDTLKENTLVEESLLRPADDSGYGPGNEQDLSETAYALSYQPLSYMSILPESYSKSENLDMPPRPLSPPIMSQYTAYAGHQLHDAAESIRETAPIGIDDTFQTGELSLIQDHEALCAPAKEQTQFSQMSDRRNLSDPTFEPVFDATLNENLKVRNDQKACAQARESAFTNERLQYYSEPHVTPTKPSTILVLETPSQQHSFVPATPCESPERWNLAATQTACPNTSLPSSPLMPLQSPTLFGSANGKCMMVKSSSAETRAENAASTMAMPTQGPSPCQSVIAQTENSRVKRFHNNLADAWAGQKSVPAVFKLQAEQTSLFEFFETVPETPTQAVANAQNEMQFLQAHIQAHRGGWNLARSQKTAASQVCSQIESSQTQRANLLAPPSPERRDSQNEEAISDSGGEASEDEDLSGCDTSFRLIFPDLAR